ncbi:hypothetical protein GCM10010145_53810 [Streptomyces ruber]|uniref:DUF4232 domain-containing protein n=2 Tax=Streptomyces TaxID=1883 RepID=A0A918BNW3_9ACTN|nr:hypothetical protein [Streptomyces ruber]GGQ77317.1 hypothetical protein GCM10010145_53810 [Streptomyces ruber]
MNHGPDEQGPASQGPEHHDHPDGEPGPGRYDGDGSGAGEATVGASGSGRGDTVGASGSGRGDTVGASGSGRGDTVGASGSGRGDTVGAPGSGKADTADIAGSDTLIGDELALRRLLQHAVDGIEPRDGTLEHLRRAVPARRARKRQAVVGMAAAVLFVGTAIPAVVHVSHSTGSDANTATVGNSQDAQGSRGQGPEDSGTASASSGSTGSPEDTEEESGAEKKQKEDEATTRGPENPEATVTPPTGSVQVCTAAQLGGAYANLGAPDATGAVYGTFRVANVSGDSCTVSGTGTVSPAAMGAADPSRVLVAGHVVGDAATGLPDPALALSQMVLQPGGGYEVKFAWVPSEPCPTTGGGGGGGGTDAPSPDPSPTDSVPDSEDTATEGTGTTTQLLKGEDIAEGSVAVTHTAPGGAPSATVTVRNACAGTIYWTGLLARS